MRSTLSVAGGGQRVIWSCCVPMLDCVLLHYTHTLLSL